MDFYICYEKQEGGNKVRGGERKNGIRIKVLEAETTEWMDIHVRGSMGIMERDNKLDSSVMLKSDCNVPLEIQLYGIVGHFPRGKQSGRVA